MVCVTSCDIYKGCVCLEITRVGEYWGGCKGLLHIIVGDSTHLQRWPNASNRNRFSLVNIEKIKPFSVIEIARKSFGNKLLSIVQRTVPHIYAEWMRDEVSAVPILEWCACVWCTEWLTDDQSSPWCCRWSPPPAWWTSLGDKEKVVDIADH